MKWKKSSKNFKNVNFNFLGTTKLYNQMHSYTHFLPTVCGDPNAATTSDVLLTGNSIDFSLSNIIIREKTKGILFWRAEYYRRLFKKNPTMTFRAGSGHFFHGAGRVSGLRFWLGSGSGYWKCPRVNYGP